MCSVIRANQIKKKKLHCQVMVIRRDDSGPFRGPASSHLYISGGGSPEKKKIAQIATIAFSYIRTEFGASRSMRVGVRSAIN